MASELSHDENGAAEMFYTRQTPWHREGHRLTDAGDFEEALRLAGVNFDVELVPYRLPGGGPSTMARAVVRADTGAELGHVGRWYQPIQNRDAFAALRPLVDTGLAVLETGGSLREGADCWLQVRWNVQKFGPIVRECFADTIVPYSVVACNHSGRRAVLAGNTPVVIVCANTLGMAESSSASRWIQVRHTGEAEVKMLEAAEALWGSVVERMEVAATQYRALKATALSAAEHQRLVVDAIVRDPRKDRRFNPDAKLAELVVERYEGKVEALQRSRAEGTGLTGDESAWEAYQGAVEVLDHRSDLFPTRGGSYRSASLMTGELAAAKQRVVQNLVELASWAAP